MGAPMNRRRITHGLLPIAGGLLGVAALPIAVAFAAPGNNIYDFPPGPVPDNHAEAVGFFGMDPGNKLSAPYSPGLTGSVQGYGQVPFAGADAAHTGTVWADISGTSTNTTYLVAQSTVPGIQPGSLFEFDNYGSPGFNLGSVYSDTIDQNGNEVFKHTLVTPLGNIPSGMKLDLSGKVFVPFHGYGDLANATYLKPGQLPDHLLNTQQFADDPKYTTADPAGPPGVNDPGVAHEYNWAPSDNIQIEAVSGLPPLDVAAQGFQDFSVTGPNGTGSFTGEVTNTGDLVLNSSQAVLVTGDVHGDAPPVGSLFMDFYLMNGKIINHYVDIYNPDGPNQITDYLEFMKKDGTPTGKTMNLPWVAKVFDGATHYNDNNFTMDTHNFTLTPDGSESIVATNGIPPVTIGVQGYREYDFSQVLKGGGSGATGSFSADETTGWSMYGDSFSRSLLVTNSTDPTVVGNGSVFMDWDSGGGWGNIYSDVISGTSSDLHHTVWDIFQTPLGDISYNLSALFNIPEYFADFFHL